MCSSGVARRRKARTLTRGLVTAAALLTVDCVQFQAAGAEATPVFESLDLGRMSVSANPAANSPWFPVRCMCICVCKSFTRRKLLHSQCPASCSETEGLLTCAAPWRLGLTLCRSLAANSHSSRSSSRSTSAPPRTGRRWRQSTASRRSSLVRPFSTVTVQSRSLARCRYLSAAAAALVRRRLLSCRNVCLCRAAASSLVDPVSVHFLHACQLLRPHWPVDCGPEWTESSSSPCR